MLSYTFIALGEILDSESFKRLSMTFMITSYWVITHSLLNLQTEFSENMQRKLDVISTCLAMMGFMNALASLFDDMLLKYQLTIQGAFYLFEILSTIFIADLPNDDKIERQDPVNPINLV